MNAVDIIAALGLPETSHVDRRVPKSLLVEHGAPTAADRRHINDHLDQLFWVAALKPTTIGVPEYRNAVREYLEIAVLRLTLRNGAERPGSAGTRLTELVHRAVSYPVLLVADDGQTDGVGLSAAHVRWSQSEAGKTVLDGDVVGAQWKSATAALAEAAAATALALSRQPQTSMWTVYQGWMDVLIALKAARVTGTFTPATSVEHSADRLDALREHERLDAEIARVRSAAAKEKQTARQVELNLALKRLDAAKAAARTRL